jgi:hypothetical protein
VRVLRKRSIGVVFSQTGSIAISAIRSSSNLVNNPSLLAEFQVSTERAASVLDGIAALNYDQDGSHLLTAHSPSRLHIAE